MCGILGNWLLLAWWEGFDCEEALYVINSIPKLYKAKDLN
jgi:hypothetical protein